MLKNISKSLWLLFFTVVICCCAYPLVLWAFGQAFFPFQANGSMVKGPDGKLVGSLLIAQPFTKDEYFQPRPSAASYDGSASASSALAASNYALRDRVARALGSIVTYRSGSSAGKPVAPDVEAWFQKDTYQGAPHLVQQWADAHNSIAQGWVTGDPTHAAYVTTWQKTHSAVVAQFIKNNATIPQPQPSDLAVVFFENYSQENPGKFPTPADIPTIFFDMWRQDHPDADLNDVPGDLVTSSASGLDPHISLQNAEFQLDRVAPKWAADLKRDPVLVRAEIEQILQEKASAPWGGLIGEKLINVLEVNLALRSKYGAPS